MHCLFGNHCEGIQLIYTAREEGTEGGAGGRASAMEVASGLVYIGVAKTATNNHRREHEKK